MLRVLHTLSPVIILLMIISIFTDEETDLGRCVPRSPEVGRERLSPDLDPGLADAHEPCSSPLCFLQLYILCPESPWAHRTSTLRGGVHQQMFCSLVSAGWAWRTQPPPSITRSTPVMCQPLFTVGGGCRWQTVYPDCPVEWLARWATGLRLLLAWINIKGGRVCLCLGQRTKKEAMGGRCLWVVEWKGSWKGWERWVPKVKEAVFLQDSTVLKCLFQALCQGLGDTRPIPSGRHYPPTLGLLQLEVEMGSLKLEKPEFSSQSYSLSSGAS